jgi:hypothetical protein
MFSGRWIQTFIAMNYHDGSPAKLGDIVSIPMSGGSARARVVMLGDTGEHLAMEAGFLEWVENEKLLDSTQAVLSGLSGIRWRIATRSMHLLGTTCSQDWIVVLHELMPTNKDSFGRSTRELDLGMERRESRRRSAKAIRG